MDMMPLGALKVWPAIGDHFVGIGGLWPFLNRLFPTY
jgi:hypothetical protein